MSLAAQSVASPGPVLFISTARTSAGAVRPNNEDAYVDRPEIGLWAVADGMGGHEHGEVASARVVEALAALEDGGSPSALMSQAAAALERVHRSLVADQPRLGLAGATVVVLLVTEGRFACLWAGDSRAYRLSGGVLRPLTHDHSLVQEMVDRGALSSAEARRDPRANVVTRAVGAGGELRLELASGAAASGDVFLLCTDGLTGIVSDQELARLLDPASLEASADRLLELALERGAPDNVTLVLAAFG